TSRYSRYLAVFTAAHAPAYLTKGKHFVPLASWGQAGKRVIAGPVQQGMQTYADYGRVKTTYKHAGMFSYSFEDNIVYKTNIDGDVLPDRLRNTAFQPSLVLNDVVINKEILFEKEIFVRD